MIKPLYNLLLVHIKDEKGNIRCVYEHRTSEITILKCLGFSCFSKYLKDYWGHAYISDKSAYFSKNYSGDSVSCITFDLVPVYIEGQNEDKK